jgi:ubiquinone/menaquinone biosynthesis C-methylase UbiE
MSEAVRAFDRSASGYDDWYRQPKGRQVLEAESALVNSLIPGEGMGLEIGAGTGVFAESLSNDNRVVVCLDPSAEMLTRAKRRGLPCVLGSAEFLPIRQGVLGFAYMVTVMEFLPSPVKAFGEATKISASFVVLFVNRDSSWGRLYAEMASRGDPIFRYAHLYSWEDVAKMSRATRLTILEAHGTLTTDPTDPAAGSDIVEPGPKAGVIAVKLANRAY